MAEFGGEYAADDEPEFCLVNAGVMVTFFGGEKKLVVGVVSVFPVTTFGGVNSCDWLEALPPSLFTVGGLCMLLRDAMSFSLKLMLFFPLVVAAPFFGESVEISPHKRDEEE